MAKVRTKFSVCETLYLGISRGFPNKETEVENLNAEPAQQDKSAYALWACGW